MRESIAENKLRGIYARIEKARARYGPKPRSSRTNRPRIPPLPRSLVDSVERDTIPAADPIAFLGTRRHPVNEPPAISGLPSLRIESSPPVAREVDASPTPFRVHPGVVLVAGAALLSTMLFAASRIHHASVTDVARNENANAAPAANANPVPTLPPSAAEGAPQETATAPVSAAASSNDSASSVVADVVLPPFHIHGTPPSPTHRVAAPLSEFDFAAAMNAVTNAGVGANDCGPEATGSVPVAVTFAPGGYVTHAVVEDSALRGTAAGSCVARQLQSIRVAPFEGRTATVRTTVVLR